MLHKIGVLVSAALVAGSLAGCTGTRSSRHPDAAQSLQRARIAKSMRPTACNMADILRGKGFGYNQTIAIIAVAMHEDPDLNPSARGIGGTGQVGLFQEPQSKLQRDAKRRHLVYNSSSFELHEILDTKTGRQFKRRHGSANQLAVVFTKNVERAAIIDRPQLEHNVRLLENK